MYQMYCENVIFFPRICHVVSWSLSQHIK